MYVLVHLSVIVIIPTAGKKVYKDKSELMMVKLQYIFLKQKMPSFERSNFKYIFKYFGFLLVVTQQVISLSSCV